MDDKTPSSPARELVEDMLMAAHAMGKIETIYGTIFEDILGEKISTKPVEIVNPFPWVKAEAKDRTER